MYELVVYYDITDLTDVSYVDDELKSFAGKEPSETDEELETRWLKFEFDSEYDYSIARQKILDAGYRLFR